MGGSSTSSNSGKPESSLTYSSSQYSIMLTFKKAIKSHSKWEDKEEFLDVIYWIRQILGLVLGLIWGLFAFTGIFGLALFFAVNAGIVYLYFTAFQKIDEEEFGGAMELIKEGMMTSFAIFLVTWIMVYSGMHFGDHDVDVLQNLKENL